ncbi:MAG: triose-phosphate isomerase [Candidatus Omnitrophica bacterium]|nr:triose-phosphate isomerase [Candidatus Omnitrophota bacterium]MCM8830783.1 triose-phosphate isomerase [Candidatus Omnitrophota bacterium]
MRKPLIVGNWKMHKTLNEAIALATAIKKEVAYLKNVDIVLCPPFTALNSVYNVIQETDIKLGAQDVFWEKEGAYTGEISPIMLKDCGCEYVIIGHSERRQYCSETDQIINKKIRAALEIGLSPICCVGESLEEREAKKTLEVINKQLTQCLANFKVEDVLGLVIAYEPVWAIGTGRNATAQQAEEVHKFIRDWFGENFSVNFSESLKILYGGSVKPTNIEELINQKDIDGVLVGGASIDATSFSQIVKKSIKNV